MTWITSAGRATIALSFASLALTGCLFSPDKGKGKDIDDDVVYEIPSSPQRVLKNLVTAYTQRDIEGYTDLLAGNYKFTPSQFDTVGYPFLTREEDLESTTSMFQSVDRITMNFVYDEQQIPPPSDLIDFPADSGYVMIVVQNVNIDVQTRELIGGEPLTLRVPGEPAKFIFRQTSASPRRYALSAIFDQAGMGRLAANL
jgi:hypothetical protein